MKIEHLNKQLTLDEYEAAKNIFIPCRELQIHSTRAAALCYKAGRKAGREEERKGVNQLHQDKHMLKQEVQQLRAIVDELTKNQAIASLESQVPDSPPEASNIEEGEQAQ